MTCTRCHCGGVGGESPGADGCVYHRRLAHRGDRHRRGTRSAGDIDRAITVLVFGIVLVLLGVTAWLVLAGAARLRQAKHAEPSHNIAVDRREQHIDARRVMLVNADGERLELPAGARLVEVMQ